MSVRHGYLKLGKESEIMLKVWERKVLRSIYGPVCKNGNWRIRKNEELKAMFQEPDLISFIRKNQLRWLGHVERMPKNRIPRKLLEGIPGGERLRGRPRLRWLDYMKRVMREMGVRGWRMEAQDMEVRRRIVEEAQALGGL